MKDIKYSILFKDTEIFMEFMAMLKNDYLDKITKWDYQWAEVVKDQIERLLDMYEWYIDEINKWNDAPKQTKTIDIITKLQEEMREEWKKAWQ